MKKFCNGNCNECSLLQVDETHGDRQLTLLLNVLVNIYGDDIIKITNNVCPNLTCCSDCHTDDFCHYENCEIDKEAKRFADNWKRVGYYAD